MAETPTEQRTRCLAAAPDMKPWEYDLALALGYQPESWDGMWKCTEHPFSVQHGCVIAREAVETGHGRSALMPDGTQKTRLVAHPLPEGWAIVNDRRLTDADPRHQLVPPHK